MLIINEMRLDDAFDEHGSAVKILGRERSFDCFGEQPMLFIPPTRFVVQSAQTRFAKATPSLVVHGLSKQGVIAIPLPSSIEGNQEQIDPFKLFEDDRAVVPIRDRITQGTRQAAQKAGL